MSQAAVSINVDDVRNAQAEWANAIRAISKTYLNGGDYVAAAAAAAGDLYAYGHGGVLFKPTKAKDVQFRPEASQAMSYFVGATAVGEADGIPEDQGFAINGGKGWSGVLFDNSQIDIHGDVAIAMGNYYFRSTADGSISTVEYTFGYKKCQDGKVRICLHHSSVPFAGDQNSTMSVPADDVKSVSHGPPSVKRAESFVTAIFSPAHTPRVKRADTFNLANTISSPAPTPRVKRAETFVVSNARSAKSGQELRVQKDVDQVVHASNSAVIHSDGSVTVDDVRNAQAEWANAIRAISKTYLDGGDYVAAAAAAAGELYGYGHGNVLFKPTKAKDVQFRPEASQAMSYFVGATAVGEADGIPEDQGFAINGGKGWSGVLFDNHGIHIHKNIAIAMGNYYFTSAADGSISKVEYTFGYRKCQDGKVRICLHHSSVPFAGDQNSTMSVTADDVKSVSHGPPSVKRAESFASNVSSPAPMPAVKRSGSFASNVSSPAPMPAVKRSESFGSNVSSPAPMPPVKRSESFASNVSSPAPMPAVKRSESFASNVSSPAPMPPVKRSESFGSNVSSPVPMLPVKLGETLGSTVSSLAPTPTARSAKSGQELRVQKAPSAMAVQMAARAQQEVDLVMQWMRQTQLEPMLQPVPETAPLPLQPMQPTAEQPLQAEFGLPSHAAVLPLTPAEVKLTAEEELKAKLAQLEDQLKEKDATIKDLAASRAHMLDAQQMAGTANQTLQKELDLLRSERQEFNSQIKSLQDEKSLLSAEQEAQRTVLHELREELGAMSSSNAELKRHLETSLLQLQDFSGDFCTVSSPAPTPTAKSRNVQRAKAPVAVQTAKKGKEQCAEKDMGLIVDSMNVDTAKLCGA